MSQVYHVRQRSVRKAGERLDDVRRWKRFESALNRLRRTARIGNYWYWVDAPELREGIEIAALVAPLRYDVLVRRDFFPFYEAHRKLWQRDRQAFMELVKQTTYYTWYRDSEAVRTNKHLWGNSPAQEADFVARVSRAIELYENFKREGFSTRYPITLKTAERLLPPTAERQGPPTGKRVSAKYFLADGCHRLALLMSQGYQVLPPDYFKVKRFREFSPFDSTSLLVRRLPVEPAAYFSYLSSHYAAPYAFTNRDELLGYIEKNKPHLLEEVLSAMRVDGFEDGQKG